MKKLLSLPPNLVECFHDIEKADQTGKRKTYFTSCRRAESSFARICAIRQNSYSHSCIPVGQRTTAVTKSAFPPAPFI